MNILPAKDWPKVLPVEGIIPVTGHRRKGKTRTVWGISELMMARTERNVLAYRFPAKLRHRLPDWVKHANTLDDLKRSERAIIVADEMSHEAHARDHASTHNKDWVKFMAILAQFGHLAFVIYQHTRQMDLNFAMDSDMVLMKPMSRLHTRFARPELRPEIEEARTFFETVKGDPREYSYLVDWHEGHKYALKSPTPSFWSDDISRAYALNMIETSERKEVKKEKKKNRKDGGK